MRMRMGTLLAAVGIPALFAVSSVVGQAGTFGGAEDVDYAAELWTAMSERGVGPLSGDTLIRGFPYVGTEPHGAVLDTLYLKVSVDGHTGDLIVKRNFAPAGVTVEEVLADPPGHLDAVTVMFKREAGFDPDNGDWFWAKYLPDGTVGTEGEMTLTGRVTGCIECHSNAPGDDMLYTTDKLM